MLVIQKSSRVLAIGSHPDDIELGAGGFIYRLVHEFEAAVTFVILTDGIQAPEHGVQYPAGQRQAEAKKAAECLCEPHEVTVVGGGFRDCTLDREGHLIIKKVEEHLYSSGGARQFDIILTHSGGDTHADHRAAYEATLSAARQFHGTILLYQAPSTKPNEFHPTLFVTLPDDVMNRKVAALKMHISQGEKPFMTEARTRGLAGSWPVFLRLPPGTSVEAFEVYKSFI